MGEIFFLFGGNLDLNCFNCSTGDLKRQKDQKMENIYNTKGILFLAEPRSCVLVVNVAVIPQ